MTPHAPAGHAGVGGLPRRERDDLAVAADRALDEVRQARELALHLVAPAGLRGLVVLAVVVADLAAEDVAGEVLEVAARDDARVGVVHGVKLPAAGTEEQHVGHEHGAGEDRLASLLVDAREAERRGKVVTLEHLLAECHELGGTAGQKPARNKKHAEPVGSEQVEAPSKEVVVRHLLAVGPLRVLRDRRAPDAVGRVGHDQSERV